jgi:hypothetical protein
LRTRLAHGIGIGNARPMMERADAVHLTLAAYARLNALIPETLP